MCGYDLRGWTYVACKYIVIVANVHFKISRKNSYREIHFVNDNGVTTIDSHNISITINICEDMINNIMCRL